MRQTINGSPGLYTAANAEILPPGSLSVAKGVVIRRPGLIQKARPFRQYSYGGDSTFPGGNLTGISSFGNRIYITDSSGALMAETGTGTGLWSNTGYVVGPYLRSAEGNNNWYMAGSAFKNGSSTRGSTGKIDASGGTPYSAGCPRALDPIMSLLSSGTLYSSGQSASYRAVITFTDANSNYVFGAPSGPVTLTATGAQDGQAKVLLPADIYNAANATSYRIQLYRSNIVASGSNPDDEMQLVADYGITSTDVSNKYVTISDNTPDNLKGILGSAYLYTNPSQQTIAAANYAPPIANDIALFKATTWYANTTQKHRASLTMLAPPEFWSVQAVSAANVPSAGQVTYTFLAAVDLTGIDNSMKLSVTGTAANNGEFPIVSVNNGTHTVVVTAAGGGAAGVLGTAITGKLTIGNTSYFPIFGASSVANHYYTVPSTGTSQAKVSAATISLVQIINQTTASNVVAYNVTSPLTPAGEMQLEEASIGGSAFTATAAGTTTAGYRGAFSITFAPAIPSATPLTSKNDNRKNRLHFGKTGQPEHCPLSDSYYFDIGSASKAILRLIPLRNALLVFKEDGLFRVTGDAGVFSWAPFDVTQILLSAGLVVSILNTAIALTGRGVWQFSETGARYLSGPVEDVVNRLTAVRDSTGSHNLESSADAVTLPTVSANSNDGLVYLYGACHTNQSQPPTDAVALVYSLATGAWTEQWIGTDGTSGQADFASMLFTQIGGARYGVAQDSELALDVYVEDQFRTAATGAASNIFPDPTASDGEPSTGHKYFINITAVNVGAKTITATSLAGPAIAVGTKIYPNSFPGQESSIYSVTAVNGAVLTLAVFYGSGVFDFTTGHAYKYAPQPIQIDYNPYSAGDDGGLNEFTEVAAVLDPLSTTTSSSVSIGCYSENWSASQMTLMPVPTATTFNRIGVEGSAQVSRHISVRITHSNPLEYFYLRGVSYLFEPVEGSVATN